MNIAIYGAGKFGQYILKNIVDSKSAKLQIKVLIDNAFQWRWRENAYNIPIVRVEQFREEFASEIDVVIVAATDQIIKQEMVLSLMGWYKGGLLIADNNILSGCLDVVSHDRVSEFCAGIIDYEEFKPELDYIEFDVTNYCNLRCKNCGHRADEATEVSISDYGVFCNSINGLTGKFSNIKTFRIMGGEPLTVNELEKYIYYLRKKFPKTKICLVSNGLLVNKTSAKVFEAIRDCNVLLEISQYPPTRKMIDEILKTAHEREIQVAIGNPIKTFFKRNETKPCPDPYSIDVIWNNCTHKRCHTLRDGRLSMCGKVYRYTVDYNGSFSNTDYYENSFDLISGTDNGWDILGAFSRPISFCSNCSNVKEYVPWEN